MIKKLKNLFKPKEKVIQSVVIDTDIKREIIQQFDKGAVPLEKLFDVTESAKEYIKYEDLTIEQKYAVEAYQDYILYIARPLRAYEQED